MPELPEVEAIRRRIGPRITGAAIERCLVARRDVVRDPMGRREGRLAQGQLGVGRAVESVDRRGKQLVFRLEGGGGFVVRLGMSGRLDLAEAADRRPVPPHRHVVWTLRKKTGDAVRLAFVDPRRFGGVHLGRDEADLALRLLGPLGPEGLEVTGDELHARLSRTTRAVKLALLDQAVVAGVGNIYADESLHAAGVHPARPGREVGRDDAERLAAAIRGILAAAIDAGGSTIRDHRLPDGSVGGFSDHLLAYGRGGRPCHACGRTLVESRLSARSTTWCPGCQRVRPRRGAS